MAKALVVIVGVGVGSINAMDGSVTVAVSGGGLRGVVGGGGGMRG